MEPQYMIIGQAAGVAAAMALKSGVAMQDVDAAALTAKLRKEGAVMEYRPFLIGPSYFHSLYNRFMPGITLKQQIQ
jgi:hypothetical protein